MGPGFGYVLLLALLPQLILAGVALVCALVAALRPGERPDLFRWLACIGLAGAVAACGFDVYGMRLNRNHIALQLWNGGLSVDHFSLFVTVTVCVFAFITCLVSDTYLRRIPSRSGGFFALVLLATAGVSAVASEHEIIALFVSLQLVLLALVGIAAVVKTEEESGAVAWRTLADGAIASALLLYGLAVLYGISGSDGLGALTAAQGRAPALSAVGIALVLAGMTFFAGLFPLRRWLVSCVDLLQAAPAGFVVTMGTTAGAVALLRFGPGGVGGANAVWAWLTSVVALIGMTHAALRALRAVRVRELAAAMVSGQSALLVLSLLASGTGASGAAAQGSAAFLFALAVFGLGTLATFATVAMVQNAGLRDSVAGFRGLAHRSPGVAVLLSFALATLAGVPPLGGFIARLFIVTSAVDAGYGWLAVVSVAASALAAVPAVRLIAAMYAEPGDELPFTLAATPRLGRMAATFCCLSAFFLTVLAQPLLLLARAGAGPIP
ncbi:MAG: hypothetical protein JOZ46_05895 [Candidatus Dormibacteraeota bacterium]|nr:hypothetical protein [Candidatus Dormibacteraeota bacterium]MBV9525331.1 hypothetical protein [Candidatus Dormibacteraeota bacterium]